MFNSGEVCSHHYRFPIIITSSSSGKIFENCFLWNGGSRAAAWSSRAAAWSRAPAWISRAGAWSSRAAPCSTGAATRSNRAAAWSSRAAPCSRAAARSRSAAWRVKHFSIFFQFATFQQYYHCDSENMVLLG